MKKLIIALLGLAILTACQKDEPKEVNADRTVLIYMAGENGLNNYVNDELKEIKAGSSSIGNNNLLVYVDRSRSSELPYLARIKDGKIKDSLSIADMNISSEDEYACDPKVMESVIRYAFQKFPSIKNDYGLVLWGHASGWLIEADSISYTAMARKAYGVDNGYNASSDYGKWLNIPTMAKLLSKLPHLTFIFADCCNFQCLESAYELRNVTDYIIGSPAEIPGVGAPYNTVVPALFEPTTFYTSIVDRYAEQHAGGHDLPLSVIKTSGMDDLANATRIALNAIAPQLDGRYPNMDGIIHYWDVYMYYDVNDFMLKYLSASDYQSWKQAFDRVIIYKIMAKEWMTHKSWSGYYYDFEVTEEKYGGVSMFVPQSWSDYYQYNRDIKQMKWYYASGMNQIGW
jgi:hypothetical protein